MLILNIKGTHILTVKIYLRDYYLRRFYIEYNKYISRNKTNDKIYTKRYRESELNFNIEIFRCLNKVVIHESRLMYEEQNGASNNLMPYITNVVIGKLK